MRKNWLYALVLVATLTAGCANDRAVSVATHDGSTAAMILSADLNRDSDLYLADFETEALKNLATLEQMTIVASAKGGPITDEIRVPIKMIFDAKRKALAANLAQARARYQVRVQLLRELSSLLLEIDKYYDLRNYQTWKAVGKGAVRGILGNAAIISDRVSTVVNAPSTGVVPNVAP